MPGSTRCRHYHPVNFGQGRLSGKAMEVALAVRSRKIAAGITGEGMGVARRPGSRLRSAGAGRPVLGVEGR